MPDRKYADATQLNLVAAREPGSDLVENCAQNVFDVALIEMRVAAGDTLNELGPNYRRRSPENLWATISSKAFAIVKLWQAS